MGDRGVLSVAEEQRSAQIAGYYDAGAAEHVKRKYRAELGPQLCDLLEDPDVTDIYKNPHSDLIWVKTHSRGTYVTPYRMDNARSLNLIGTIAGAYNLEISPNSPRLEAPLPFHGARFSAKIQPNVAGPSWFLRKRTSHIRTLDDYVADGIATREQVEVIESFVARRHNILVGGPMGAGKTSLANAVLYAMHQHDTPDERYCILEDTPELQCMAPNSRRDDHLPAAGHRHERAAP